LVLIVQDTLVTQLQEKAADGSDLDGRVITAYLNQCTAEAQVGIIHLRRWLACGPKPFLWNANLLSSSSGDVSPFLSSGEGICWPSMLMVVTKSTFT
jgi:hypothetical protein